MTEKRKKLKITKILKWLERNEEKIVFALGAFLIAVISFEFGVLQGQKWQRDPLIIKGAEKLSVETNKVGNTEKRIVAEKKDPASEEYVAKKNNDFVNDKECLFVGSKKSKKYHKKNCRFVSRIKAENKICFKNRNDAERQGYVPAHCLGEKK